MVLILAAVGLQGGPQSPGCRSELGHKEGRDSPAGLYHRARPAPAASAELALTQESFGKEEVTAWGTEESQTSQTARLLIAKTETSFAEENLGSVVRKHLSVTLWPCDLVPTHTPSTSHPAVSSPEKLFRVCAYPSTSF